MTVPPGMHEFKDANGPEGMSLGANRVRESFNPGGVTLVDKFKRYTADLIDLCHEETSKLDNKVAASETVRLWSLAMTHYEEAAMWAVKAATTGLEKK